MARISLTYKIIKKIGLNYSETEYGQISFFKVLKRVFKTYRDGFLLKFLMESWLLAPLLPRRIRPWIVKKIGANVGKNVFIGSKVWVDSGHADMLILEDHVHIAGESTLLCHQRNLKNYCVGSGTHFENVKKIILRDSLFNVTLLDRLPSNDYQKLLSISDFGIALLNPRYKVPQFPSKIIDYLKLSKPVLAITNKMRMLEESSVIMLQDSVLIHMILMIFYPSLIKFVQTHII